MLVVITIMKMEGIFCVICHIPTHMILLIGTYIRYEIYIKHIHIYITKSALSLICMLQIIMELYLENSTSVVGRKVQPENQFLSLVFIFNAKV